MLPIAHAAVRGDAFLARFLVRAGALLNFECEFVDDAGDIYRQTPMMIATQHGNVEVVRIIAAGVDVNQVRRPFQDYKRPSISYKRPVKPQLQIRAGAETSTDTREIINRYRTLGCGLNQYFSSQY